MQQGVVNPMLVSSKVHLQALTELAAVRARVEELSRRVAAQDATLALQWMRIAQLEKERAILFRQVTQLPIPVPEIVQNPIPTSADHLAALFDHVEDEKTPAYDH